MELIGQLFLITFDLIFFYLVVSLLRFIFVLVTGMRLALDQRIYSRELAGGSPRILLLGDSAAVGTGTQDRQRSLSGRLAHALPEASVENRSRIGLKVATMLPRLQAIEGHYDLLILLVAANDIIRSTKRSVIKQHMPGLVQAAASKADTVLLCTVGEVGNAPFFPRWVAPYFNRLSRHFTEVAEAAARAHHNVICVNLNETYEGRNLNSDPTLFYAKDYLHLSEEGYALWYGKVMETLQAHPECSFYHHAINMPKPEFLQTNRKNDSLDLVWRRTISSMRSFEATAKALRDRVL